ncbi:MAG: aminotransferase class V-fold PLP-dependent enzyme [Spirochaetes bacterium]|nr:aminotransferase class V-fold PLP-dependent enzyme [Spirochaetota bacterium]
MKKPVWLVVNFIDNLQLEAEASEFFELGFSETYFVSALNHRNVGSLRQEIQSHFATGKDRALISPVPGTTNAPLVATLAQALDYAVAEQASDALRIGAFRDTLQARLQSHYPQMVVNGDTAHRVAGALHISLPSIDNKEFITRFRDRLALSTGAACSSGSERPSHVLRAMHLPDALIAGALRISLGRFTTESEVETAAVMLCSR